MLEPEEPEDPKELAAKYAPWAKRVALAFVLNYNLAHVRDDLIGVALLTLSKTAERFDPTLGRFKTFAYKRVTGEILDAIAAELRHVAFLRAPMLEVPADEDGEGSTERTIEASLATIDAVLDDAMSRAYLAGLGEDQHRSGEANVIEQEDKRRVRGEIGRLPRDAQKLIELRYFKGLAWKQVAEALDLPERTAKDHDQKIRHKLRDHLG